MKAAHDITELIAIRTETLAVREDGDEARDDDDMSPTVGGRSCWRNILSFGS